LLKKDGHYLEIGIGEKDTMALKKIFGKGQNYGNWNKSRLEKDKKELIRLGFKIIFAKNFNYSEYYQSPEEMDIFLQGVPIFEDYSSEIDKKHLDTYCNKYQTKKGIILSRHRVIYVARKQ
jgi:hypothetical protein